MFHYLFTNDLRISNLESFLCEAGKCFVNNCVPSATVDKNANNNMNTLGFYFNLTKESNCAKACVQGDIRKVVLNFIKKFQFPNPRTTESLNQALDDGITLAPMRVILQVLYLLNMVDSKNAYLTKEEIAEYIFFDEKIAKQIRPDLIGLIKEIVDGRLSGEKKEFLSDVELEKKGCYWKQCKRQVREMVKVLCWSGCVMENSEGAIAIHHEYLTRDNEADLFEILTYRGRWIPDKHKSINENKLSYQKYMDIELDFSAIREKGINEYRRAAQIIKDYILGSGLQFEETEEDIRGFYEEFRNRFSPETLQKIPDSELLRRMFYSTETTNDSLCYWLEFNQYSRKYCGSIAGGSSYKFGLFQRKEDGIWMTGSPNRPEELSDEQALEIARNIRGMLLKGAELIKKSELSDLSCYEKLDKELNDVIGKYAALGWVHKYFHMLYPDKLSAFHSTDWQRHVLFALRIEPSSCYFARSGQIAIVSQYTQLYYRHFFEAFVNKFGRVKKFCRLGTSDREINYADEWKQHKLVAVGWDGLGTLTDYVVGNDINKKILSEKMQEIYYHDNVQMASRKAGEVATFYRSNRDTVFVAMNGEDLLALVDEVGEYYFDVDKSMAHRKAGVWHVCFAADEKLPNKSAGHMTTCYELTDDENLLYLYEKYYYDLSDKQEEEVVEEMKVFIPLVLNTGLVTEFERNRIVFGAPGTGKSYKLKQDSEEILKNTEGSLERVTFHPDYSYSQFVGTYKPVSDVTGDIRYKFVPGPFMRVYIDALKSGRTENPQPHVLLVEEINRARVAAVFGDVFQLLDRDANGVSEYSIQSTEDIRKYLAEELGGKPENYQYIQIPNNMFIWATMNSADQGVFPMDTAFKRRWSFQYIGIDDSEENVKDYEIPIGMGNNRKYINWNQLRKAINDILSDECKVNEDKLLGPFFISKSMLDNALQDEDKFVKAFESKVIMYLFEDVMKMRPSGIFKGHDKNNGKMIFSELCKAFEEHCEEIFGLKDMSYVKEIEQ